MFDVVALGELLIDFTYSGTSAAGMKLFEQNPGGAVANVLTAAARLGKSAAFIGKIGTDMHGAFLKETLDRVGIDTTGLVMTEDFFTTLAFIALSETGERTFSFARKPGADTRLTAEEVDSSVVSAARIFHIGSLSLTDEPARGATYHAVKLAKASGAVISYDPNYRAPLWPDEETAKREMRGILKHIDIMKLSNEETRLLTDWEMPEDAAKFLNDSGITCVAVTLGKKGALVSAGGCSKIVPGYHHPAVDTTGAGDAFWGGFLYRLLALNKKPSILSLTDAVDCANWGNAVATCCVQKRGGIPAMPTLEEVLHLLEAGNV